MGNCQASEAATVVIQHPGKKVERENETPLKQLKLLRPDDTFLSFSFD